MKHKKPWTSLLLAALLSLTLTGCQLAQEAGEGGQADTLIGGVVTLGAGEEAIDWAAYLEAHPEAAGGTEASALTTAQKYETKLYADKGPQIALDPATGQQVEQEGYTFPAVRGVFFSYDLERDQENDHVSVKSAPNLGFWEGSVNAGSKNHQQPDETWSVELRGTVYYAAQGDAPVITVHPVYRAPDGEVYLTLGGTSVQGEGLTACYGEFRTVEIQGKESTEETTLQVTAKSKHPAQHILLVQMDRQDREVKRQEYRPGQLPETLTPEAATAYLLLVSCYTDQQGQEAMDRTLIQASEEYLYTPYLMDNGFFGAQPTKILWQKG